MSQKKQFVISCFSIFSGGALLAALPWASWGAESNAHAATALAATGLAEDAPIGWEKMGSSDGIDVFKKEIPGDPVVAVRGEGIVDAPIARVASVVMDDDRAREWVDSLSDSKLLKMYGDREFLEYTHIGTPFVLKDRDFLTHGDIKTDLVKKTIVMNMWSVEDPLMPPTKYVRGILKGYWKMRSIENDTKTYLIAEMHADPKGSVPKWIVNLFQKGWAKDTIERLRKQVAKKDIKIIPQVTKVFALPEAAAATR